MRVQTIFCYSQTFPNWIVSVSPAENPQHQSLAERKTTRTPTTTSTKTRGEWELRRKTRIEHRMMHTHAHTAIGSSCCDITFWIDILHSLVFASYSFVLSLSLSHGCAWFSGSESNKWDVLCSTLFAATHLYKTRINSNRAATSFHYSYWFTLKNESPLSKEFNDTTQCTIDFSKRSAQWNKQKSCNVPGTIE